MTPSGKRDKFKKVLFSLEPVSTKREEKMVLRTDLLHYSYTVVMIHDESCTNPTPRSEKTDASSHFHSRS